MSTPKPSLFQSKPERELSCSKERAPVIAMEPPLSMLKSFQTKENPMSSLYQSRMETSLNLMSANNGKLPLSQDGPEKLKLDLAQITIKTGQLFKSLSLTQIKMTAFLKTSGVTPK